MAFITMTMKGHLMGKILPKKGKNLPSAGELAADARRLVEEAAAYRRPGETVEAMLARVAYMTGFSYSRIRTFWQRKPAAYRHGELDTLRSRILALQKRQQQGIDHAASLLATHRELLVGVHQRAADVARPGPAVAGAEADERGSLAGSDGEAGLTGWGFKIGGKE